MAKVGRPTKYESRFTDMAYLVCRDGGYTDKNLKDLFGICDATLYNWKNQHPEFLDAIKRGKDEFDTSTAENCLLKRVTGYKYTETTKELSNKTDTETGKGKLITTKKVIKSLAPDVTALIFFLKNRNPQRWRDVRVEYAELGDKTLNIAERLTKALERKDA